MPLVTLVGRLSIGRSNLEMGRVVQLLLPEVVCLLLWSVGL